MPHLLPILIRGINNLSDARYCAGMGADKLTFILDPALPGFLDAKTVKELAGWVAGVELIGEFDQLPAAEINAIAAECALDAVLLRQPRSVEELVEIAPPTYAELPIGSVNIALYVLASPVGLVIELSEPLTTETLTALQAIAHQRPL